MKVLSIISFIVASLFLTNVAIAEDCITPTQMNESAANSGAYPVHDGYVEDGLTYTFYWKAGVEEVLVIGFKDGCVANVLVITAEQLRLVTGVVVVSDADKD